MRDVAWYTLTAFGGAQAHLGIMLDIFVTKHRYISKTELLELNALTQVLPGPASTQTLVGIAYKVGGLPLSILTFFIWILPSASLMSFAAISYSMVGEKEKFEAILKFIQPIAVGIVGSAAFVLGRSMIKSQTATWLAISSLIATLILRNAYVFPILILIGGIISSAIDTPPEESALRSKLFSNINPKKIAYFTGILLLFAALGAIINRTSPFSLPIRLFENFYRNGILIFGGGQVLVPYMFTEFVQMKHYLSAEQFLSGYAFQQAIPGPTFAFTSFLGGIALKNAGYGILGQMLGSLVAVLGINLPGLILILFIVPFWNDLKKISRIKNSLSGINAVSVGFLAAAIVFLLQPIGISLLSVSVMLTTFCLLSFTRIQAPFLIIGGVILGLIF
ncbi:chromate efflux transporter [Flavihumibacter sp. R14]|nr:chromate efflux transporter [Flavihumibacter soli]